MVTLRRFGAGQSVRRTEDRRLLMGHGRYTSDVSLPHQLHGQVLRAPHAHARIARIETRAAAAAPGVRLVLSAAELAAAGARPYPCIAPVLNRDGTPCHMTEWPALAVERVRYVGEGVAFIVADTISQARDAAELVEVDYEPLPAVTGTAATIGSGIEVWPDAPANLCCDWAFGDPGATEAVFARAHHVTTLDLVNNRIVVAPMETRGIVGEYRPGDERYSLHISSQSVHGMRGALADALGVPTNRLHLVTPDVGGAFGMKGVPFPEYVLVLVAARLTGRPVKWIAGRGEAFLSDTHGRDHATRAELALDAEGRFLAIRARMIANMGAYLSYFGPCVPTEPAALMLAGAYAIPSVDVSCKLVYTHTVPVDAYRGAGRPEASYVVERLVDKAARETGIGPAELRRRNLVEKGRFPCATATGLTYDSGDYARNLADALEHAGWAGAAGRKAEAAARGRLRGIGMSYYIEICGTGGSELAEARVDGAGNVTLMVGTQSVGQGHETAFAQVLSTWLGVPMARIRVIEGDSEVVGDGRGSGGSRSLQTAGPAILMAAERVVAKAQAIAADMLEAAPADMAYNDGTFEVAGTDRRVSFDAVAARAHQPDALPPGMEPGLDETANYRQQAFTFPNGCHICEVEVDPETGAIDVLAYVVTDDFGRVINPMLVEGQVHGGVAQALGQALLERTAYDRAGQLLSASFMDYCIPRAGDMPGIAFHYNEFPSPSNPMGVKGCGESGCVGGPAAFVSAVLDALEPRGVRHLDMPLTPERVWRAIREGDA